MLINVIFCLSLLYLNSENLSLALPGPVAFGSFWVLIVQADTTVIQCKHFNTYCCIFAYSINISQVRLKESYCPSCESCNKVARRSRAEQNKGEYRQYVLITASYF